MDIGNKRFVVSLHVHAQQAYGKSTVSRGPPSDWDTAD